MLDFNSTDWDCTVLIGDCLDVLPQIPKGMVDCIVTDPPYESLERHRAVGTTTRLKESKSSSNSWFETFPNKCYWGLFTLLYNAAKEDTHCYIFCDSETEHVILSGRNPYNSKLDGELVNAVQTWASARLPIECGWHAWPTLTWIKTKQGVEAFLADDPSKLEGNGVAIGMGYHWRRSGERILFLERGKRRLNYRGYPDTLLGPRARKSDFPTQKPACVLERLICNSSKPGEIILDCFAGSGSTAIAAIRQGRRAILIEKFPTEALRCNLANCNKADDTPLGRLPAKVVWG